MTIIELILVIAFGYVLHKTFKDHESRLFALEYRIFSKPEQAGETNVSEEPVIEYEVDNGECE